MLDEKGRILRYCIAVRQSAGPVPILLPFLRLPFYFQLLGLIVSPEHNDTNPILVCALRFALPSAWSVLSTQIAAQITFLFTAFASTLIMVFTAVNFVINTAYKPNLLLRVMYATLAVFTGPLLLPMVEICSAPLARAPNALIVPPFPIGDTMFTLIYGTAGMLLVAGMTTVALWFRLVSYNQPLRQKTTFGIALPVPTYGLDVVAAVVVTVLSATSAFGWGASHTVELAAILAATLGATGVMTAVYPPHAHVLVSLLQSSAILGLGGAALLAAGDPVHVWLAFPAALALLTPLGIARTLYLRHVFDTPGATIPGWLVPAAMQFILMRVAHRKVFVANIQAIRLRTELLTVSGKTEAKEELHNTKKVAVRAIVRRSEELLAARGSAAGRVFVSQLNLNVAKNIPLAIAEVKRSLSIEQAGLVTFPVHLAVLLHMQLADGKNAYSTADGMGDSLTAEKTEELIAKERLAFTEATEAKKAVQQLWAALATANPNIGEFLRAARQIQLHAHRAEKLFTEVVTHFPGREHLLKRYRDFIDTVRNDQVRVKRVNQYLDRLADEGGFDSGSQAASTAASSVNVNGFLNAEFGHYGLATTSVKRRLVIFPALGAIVFIAIMAISQALLVAVDDLQSYTIDVVDASVNMHRAAMHAVVGEAAASGLALDAALASVTSAANVLTPQVLGLSPASKVGGVIHGTLTVPAGLSVETTSTLAAVQSVAAHFGSMPGDVRGINADLLSVALFQLAEDVGSVTTPYIIGIAVFFVASAGGAALLVLATWRYVRVHFDNSKNVQEQCINVFFHIDPLTVKHQVAQFKSKPSHSTVARPPSHRPRRVPSKIVFSPASDQNTDDPVTDSGLSDDAFVTTTSGGNSSDQAPAPKTIEGKSVSKEVNFASTLLHQQNARLMATFRSFTLRLRVVYVLLWACVVMSMACLATIAVLSTVVLSLTPSVLTSFTLMKDVTATLHTFEAAMHRRTWHAMAFIETGDYTSYTGYRAAVAATDPQAVLLEPVRHSIERYVFSAVGTTVEAAAQLDHLESVALSLGYSVHPAAAAVPLLQCTIGGLVYNYTGETSYMMDVARYDRPIFYTTPAMDAARPEETRLDVARAVLTDEKYWEGRVGITTTVRDVRQRLLTSGMAAATQLVDVTDRLLEWQGYVLSFLLFIRVLSAALLFTAMYLNIRLKSVDFQRLNNTSRIYNSTALRMSDLSLGTGSSIFGIDQTSSVGGSAMTLDTVISLDSRDVTTTGGRTSSIFSTNTQDKFTRSLSSLMLSEADLMNGVVTQPATRIKKLRHLTQNMMLMTSFTVIITFAISFFMNIVAGTIGSEVSTINTLLLQDVSFSSTINDITRQAAGLLDAARRAAYTGDVTRLAEVQAALDLPEALQRTVELEYGVDCTTAIEAAQSVVGLVRVSMTILSNVIDAPDSYCPQCRTDYNITADRPHDTVLHPTVPRYTTPGQDAALSPEAQVGLARSLLLDPVMAGLTDELWGRLDALKDAATISSQVTGALTSIGWRSAVFFGVVLIIFYTFYRFTKSVVTIARPKPPRSVQIVRHKIFFPRINTVARRTKVIMTALAALFVVVIVGNAVVLVPVYFVHSIPSAAAQVNHAVSAAATAAYLPTVRADVDRSFATLTARLNAIATSRHSLAGDTMLHPAAGIPSFSPEVDPQLAAAVGLAVSLDPASVGCGVAPSDAAPVTSALTGLSTKLWADVAALSSVSGSVLQAVRWVMLFIAAVMVAVLIFVYFAFLRRVVNQVNAETQMVQELIDLIPTDGLRVNTLLGDYMRDHFKKQIGGTDTGTATGERSASGGRPP